MAETPSFPSFPRDSSHSTGESSAFGVAHEGSAEDQAAALLAFASSHHTSPTPVQRPRRGVSRGVILSGGIALLAVLGLGSGAAWAMSDHGDYAYQHVASGASVYAQLNMEPSLMQKAQIMSFLSKLPKVKGESVQDKATDSNSVAKILLDRLIPNNGISEYGWAGSRYAVVAYGDLQSLEGTPKAAIIMQVSNQDNALMVVRAALQARNSELQVRSLDENYIVLGTPEGIQAATKSGAHLGDEAKFKHLYTESGDPLSYWSVQDGVTAAGGVRAGWGSMQLTGESSGSPLGVSAAAEAQNLSLTGRNSIASPLLNVGLAEPNALFGPDSAFGKQLSSLAPAYLGSEAGEAKQKLAAVTEALGDNVSVSTNEKGGQVLLHGSDEKKVNAAISAISGEKTTLQELGSEFSSKIKVQTIEQGLLISYGSAQSAPTGLEKVAPGTFIAQVDLKNLPESVIGSDPAKWGSISFSAASTTEGNKVEASWDLP